MEFFVCRCSATAQVILDGNNLGPNMNSAGNLLTKQCKAGFHTITLQCMAGRSCSPPQVTTVIKNTNPISPRVVPFQCV